jgi:hypothetical protein
VVQDALLEVPGVPELIAKWAEQSAHEPKSKKQKLDEKRKLDEMQMIKSTIQTELGDFKNFCKTGACSAHQPLVAGGESNAARWRLIRRVQAEGVQAERLTGSSNEVWLIQLPCSIKLGIFKPWDGESVDRHCFKKGDMAIREEGIYVLSVIAGLSIVPPTTRTTIKVNQDDTKYGSIQEFAIGKPLEELEYMPTVLSQIGIRSAAELSILDMCTGQTDRHPGNAFLSPSFELIGIDNGLGLPPLCGIHPCFDAWIKLPQLQGCPSPDALMIARRMYATLSTICNALATMGMDPCAIATVRLLTAFVKTAVVDFELPIASCAKLLVRVWDEERGIEGLSWLQKMMLCTAGGALRVEPDRRGDLILCADQAWDFEGFLSDMIGNLRLMIWQEFPDCCLCLTLDEMVCERDLGLVLAPPPSLRVESVSGGWAATQNIVAGFLLKTVDKIEAATMTASALQQAFKEQRPLRLTFARPSGGSSGSALPP